MKQYVCLLHSTTTPLIHKDKLFVYIIENYPEIVSVYDLITEDRPYYKYIWTFRKQDEKLVEKIFDDLEFVYRKYEIEYNGKILVYVINQIINCDFNDVNRIKCEEAQSKQQYGYKPFNEFRKMIIPHGMGWYLYQNPNKCFQSICEIFPVRSLPIKENEDENWSKVGYREDLQCSFRSAWEANIARIFNSKDISWKYEEEMYDLEPPQYYTETKSINVNTGKSVIYYEPDFVLEDGTIIEVKGFWDNRSKVRVSQFMAQYPDKKYLVIDTDLYCCISKKV